MQPSERPGPGGGIVISALLAITVKNQVREFSSRTASHLRAGAATRALTVLFVLSLGTALPQSIPVQPNFWRLEFQEDTDDDHKITVHDHTTPFELRDEHG